MIKKLFFLFLISYSILIFADWPNLIGPDDYCFPESVRQDWKDTNNLRNLPEPDTTYIASDSTIVTKNGVEYVFHFYANCDSCNSSELKNFIHLMNNENAENPIELYFPDGVYLF